jgi:hypothetical protein
VIAREVLPDRQRLDVERRLHCLEVQRHFMEQPLRVSALSPRLSPPQRLRSPPHWSKAAPLTVDGNLADWGLSVADNNASTTSGSSMDSGGTLLPALAAALSAALGSDLHGYAVDDRNDTAGHGGYLYPNYGGQDYDAEFLGVARQGNTLFFAIQTGQRPDNGFANFALGDIVITTSGGDYGIETFGATFVLENNGHTKGVRNSDGTSAGVLSDPTGQIVANPPPAQSAGTLWKVNSDNSSTGWYLDPIATTPGRQKTQLLSGMLIGAINYAYTGNSVTAQHAMLEGSIDLSLFGTDEVLGIAWLPACGNDSLDVNVNIASVPAPASLVLFGLGMLGIGFVRRKPRA